MTETVNQEQELCISCGFCCDGTLFNRARSDESEVVLAEMLKFKDEDGNHWIKLPCPYFEKHCKVYKQNRPHVCSSFKCSLLEKLINKGIAFEEALELVKKVHEQKSRIQAMIPFSETHLQVHENFENFLKEFEKELDTKEFRIKYFNLLSEWASYQKKLKYFIEQTADKCQ